MVYNNHKVNTGYGSGSLLRLLIRRLLLYRRQLPISSMASAAPDGVFQNRKRFFFSYLHPFLRWLFSHVAISFNDFVETFFHISHWLAMCCDLTLTIIRRIYVDKVDFALMHFF